MREIISVLVLIMWGVLVLYLAKTLKKSETKKTTKVLIGMCAVLSLAGLVYLCSDLLVPAKTEETSEINMITETMIIGDSEDENSKRVEIDYNAYKKVFEDELRVIKDDILTYKMFIEYCSDKIEYTEDEFVAYMKDAFEYNYGKSDDMEAIAKEYDLDYEFLKLLYLESFSRDLYLDKIIEGLEVTDDEVSIEYGNDPESYHYADLIYIPCDSEEVLQAAIKMLDIDGLEGLDHIEGVEVIETTINLYDHGLGITVNDPELLDIAQTYINPETGEYYIAAVTSINTTFEECFEHAKGHLLEDKAMDILNAEITEFYQTVTME